MIKVNVDDSSIGNARSLFGGIIINSFGCWITRFVKSCCHINNINVELCEADSQTTLTFIKDGVSPTHLYAPLIDNIHSFMLRD